jgi:uncharacterized protein (DUF1697 family)
MMARWIALIRGINVGGKNMVPMKALVADLTAAGCEDVRHYLQSGNIVLSHKSKSAGTVAKLVSGTIERTRGFAPEVMVLSAQEVDAAIADNPFPEAEADHKSLHVVFLGAEPKSDDVARLRDIQKDERYEVKGKVMYLHTPKGLLSSKIAERPDKWLKVPATARNWRTVTALMELAAV